MVPFPSFPFESRVLLIVQGGRHSLHVPGEPQKVHPGHKDGIRRSQEGEGPKRFDRLFEGEHSVKTIRDLGTFLLRGKILDTLASGWCV